MDAQYQIPKRSVLAEVVLPGIEPLSLKLYLSERAQSHAGFERPSDLLNGSERFLPAADAEDRVVFLHRDSVLTIAVDACSSLRARYDCIPSFVGAGSLARYRLT